MLCACGGGGKVAQLSEFGVCACSCTHTHTHKMFTHCCCYVNITQSWDNPVPPSTDMKYDDGYEELGASAWTAAQVRIKAPSTWNIHAFSYHRM